MKKILSFILAVVTLLSCNVSAENIDAKTAFTTVKIPIPDTIPENDTWNTYAIYEDTGELITLSEVYDGYVQATVPTEYKDRPIDAIVPQEKEFTDISNNSDYFDLLWLSRTCVVEGNEFGEAQPLKIVTRAEAVTMIMRFMGLESLSADFARSLPEDYRCEFDDVKNSDWFFPYVTYAEKIGIVHGNGENMFIPGRSITREELTVMISRALEYAGLKCPAGSFEKTQDTDKISSWAKDAFERIGICCLLDYPEENDWEDPTSLLNPQTVAARVDAARLLNNIQGVCQQYPCETAVKYGFDKEMPVIDGSTSTYPFTQAVYQHLFSSGLTHSGLPKKHSKTHNSYERLINGEVDMLFASHHPASDILKLAEEKGVELELIPIAYDAMVFFTNADNPTDGLTQQQITDIYVNNKYKNWSEIGGSDALLHPYCRNNDSGSHAQMEKHFLNGGEIHPEVQKETSYTMSNILTDVMAAQTDDPTGYGLGYSIYYYFQNMDLFYDTNTVLKLLAIDGVMPSDETIADGSYPLSNNTYIVLRKDSPENSPERKMAEFMLTEQGQDCVEEAGFGKLIK